MTVFAISCNLAEAADKNAPENKPGYVKSKDVGAAAPANADIPFDGTMKSVKENWEMWPQQDMAITWSIVDNPTGDGKTLMTNGGKRWGTHDLVTKKKYTEAMTKSTATAIVVFTYKTDTNCKSSLPKARMRTIRTIGRSVHTGSEHSAWNAYPM